MSIDNIIRVLQTGGPCDADKSNHGHGEGGLKERGETPPSASMADPRQLLEFAKDHNGGDRGWRGWKVAQSERVVEMAEKAPRMTLLKLDLQGDLNIVYGVAMPVPLTPFHGALRIGNHAVFHLRYAETWRWESPEGWEPLGLLHPIDPFHPNARPSLRGAICLGNLPPGIQPTEIVLLGYFTLSLQDVMLNEADPNGVMNSEACDYFRENPQYVPLTDAGLFDPLKTEQ